MKKKRFALLLFFALTCGAISSFAQAKLLPSDAKPITLPNTDPVDPKPGTKPNPGNHTKPGVAIAKPTDNGNGKGKPGTTATKPADGGKKKPDVTTKPAKPSATRSLLRILPRRRQPIPSGPSAAASALTSAGWASSTQKLAAAPAGSASAGWVISRPTGKRSAPSGTTNFPCNCRPNA